MRRSGEWHYGYERLTPTPRSLNIRSATNTYRMLEEFIHLADKEAVARGEGPIDTSIDRDFRSGVALGVGFVSINLNST